MTQHQALPRIVGFCLSALIVMMVVPSMAALEEKQAAEMNQTLKSAIEENQALQAELQKLREEKTDYQKQMDKVRSQNRQYSQELQSMEARLQEVSGAQGAQVMEVAQVKEASESVAIAEPIMPSVADDQTVSREGKTLDLLSKIDAFAEEDERLRSDAAKAHYNMGNIYFQKGEYEIAAREYYQAVTLMPDDPDAHYNLAFVSGEYLSDFKTALKHFQMYLYLNPNAKDAYFVKEKIISAKLHLKNVVDSPLEKKFK